MAGPSKLVLATVLFLAAALGARAAWAARRSGGTGLALAGAFAGGALLNAGLVHLLADASREMAEGQEEPYPTAELLCGLGALLTHLFETIGESLWPGAHGEETDHACSQGTDPEAPDGEASLEEAPDGLGSPELSRPSFADAEGAQGAGHGSLPSSSSSAAAAALQASGKLGSPPRLESGRPSPRARPGRGWKPCGLWQCLFPSLQAASNPSLHPSSSGRGSSRSAASLSPAKGQKAGSGTAREAPYIVGCSYDEEDQISSGSPPNEDRHLVCSSRTKFPATSPRPGEMGNFGRKRRTDHGAGRGGPLAGPLLLLALSFHALLEGLSLGASGGGQAMSLFLAILLHKSVAAFSLGVTWLAGYVEELAGKRYIGAMLWFSSVTPLGIILASPLEGSSIGAWVQALSSGTFLYIGLVESCPGIRAPWLSERRSKLRGARYIQLATYMLGFACMGLLGLWT